ncbi:hypothetical protein [Deinococcus sp.]|uniref:hypothetical protein n=1 Tax=Deinococcus sp. TaxID=47478 RepID=UPI0025C206B4|nr:hypothetical protein [Deinococcus sp.]
MYPLRRHHEFEYRSHSGEDQLGRVDIWTDVAAARAVLVLRDLPSQEAACALNALNNTVLPYLLRPDTNLLILVLHPGEAGVKARALVLPQSA